MPALGITLNNLGNIRLTTDVWQGSSPNAENKTFVTFVAPKWSIRAMARIIILYQDHLGKGTITIPEIISKWAPNSENNTQEYISNVCVWGNFLPTVEYDVTTFDVMSRLVQSMIEMEVGIKEYDIAVVTEGLKLAGVVAPNPPLAKSPAMTVAGVVAVSGAAQPVLNSLSGLVTSASPFAPMLETMIHKAPYGIAVALFAGVGYLIYHELEKRKVTA